jgi:hypothetical protein
MLEKFAEFGVTPAQIEARIQRNLDAITAPLMVELGRIYNSLRDGMSRPDAWFEVIVPVAASPAEAAKAALRGRRMAAKPESQPDPGPAQDFNPEASRAADAEAPK